MLTFLAETVDLRERSRRRRAPLALAPGPYELLSNANLFNAHVRAQETAAGVEW